jgi:hypothetical protein
MGYGCNISLCNKSPSKKSQRSTKGEGSILVKCHPFNCNNLAFRRESGVDDKLQSLLAIPGENYKQGYVVAR